MRTMILFAVLVSSAGFAQEQVTERPDFAVSEGCESGKADALPTGPIAAPYHEADVATGRRACPRTEVGIGGQGGVTYDTPNFYGGIEAAAVVFGSYALNNDTELFGMLEVFRSHYVVEATLETTATSIGTATVGATHIAYRSGDLLLAPSVRLLLPTSFAANVHNIGGEVGLAYNQRLLDKLELHGYGGVDGSMAFLSPAASYPRGGALVNFGAQFNVLSFVGLALDVNGHFFTRSTLDYIAPALAFRFRVAEVGIELGASAPIAGADPRLVTGLLRVSNRF